MPLISEVANIIKSNDYFGIVTHVYPDGDALGSAFALCLALQKLGKHARVICGAKIPEKFNYLADGITFEEFDEKFIIAVDLADIDLLEPDLKHYESKIDLCLDHHISNKKYAKLNYIEDVAANCEIIYKLVKEMNVSIDADIASALYTGISTDTGCFKYSNTSANSHFVASELIKLGARVEQINEKLFITKSIKQLETEKIINNNLKYFMNGRCALTSISLQEMKKIGISDGELDGIASIPIRVEGAEIGITIREKDVGVCKVSVRTRGGIDANEFCQNFGGGGHKRAAGFNYHGSIQDTENAILKFLKF